MKHLLLLLVILLGFENVKAQVGYYYSYPTEEIKGDTLKFLKEKFEIHKADFIGKPAKLVFEEYRKYMPIKFVVEEETSAYIDPEGKAYLDGVSLYNIPQGTLMERGFYKLRIKFEDTNLEFYDYVHSIPEDTYNVEVFSYLENYIVKDLYVIYRNYAK